MSERDDELLRRYRAMPREAPPASIDASILAASRRAVARRPASRWAVPVSIAAVLVLAFGVVMEMQRQAPDDAATAPPSAATTPAAPAPAAPAATAPEPKSFAVPARPAARAKAQMEIAPPRGSRQIEHADATTRANAAPQREQAGRPEPQAKQAPVATGEAGPSTATPASPPAPLSAQSARIAASPPAAAAARSGAATADPLAQELERIARLRDEGRDEEADKALEAFRREHPDYRIAPALWERVKGKP